MPSNIRLFWWINVAIVTYWLISAIWLLAFPDAQYVAMLAKLPRDLRQQAQETDTMARILSVSVWGIATIGLAWLVAYRQLNWARWAFLVIFLVRACISLIMIFYHHPSGQYVAEDIRKNLADIASIVVMALTTVAIILVFSRNAKVWFNRRT